MNQQEIDARLAAIGGSGLTHTPILTKKTIKAQRPDSFGDMVSTDVEVVVQRWVNPTTGHVLEAAQLPDGTWDIQKDDPKGATPKPEGASRSTAAGADPNTPQGRNEAALQAQREKNAALPSGQDPAYETDADRAKRAQDRITQQGKDAKDADAKVERDRKEAEAANKPTISYRAVKQADGSTKNVRIKTYPDGREEVEGSAVPGDQAPRPKDSEIREIDGEQVEVIRDPATGAIKERRPVTGSASSRAAGPQMPEIIVGQSQEALRKYRQALNVAVESGQMTPAQADKRWGEIKDVANNVVSEAVLGQRERESSRNADITRSTTRLDAMQTGLGQAIDFANNVIKGGSGSQSAGAMFSALLGLQMLQIERSGINGAGEQQKLAGGPPPAPLPTISTADLIDPVRAEAKRAEIAAHPVFSPAPPVSAPVPPTVPGAASVAPRPAALSAPAISPAQAAANAGPVPGQDGGIWYPPAPVMDAQAAADAGPVPGQDGSVWTPPPAVPETPPAPDYGQPGMNVLPQPGQMPVDATGAGGTVQKTMGPAPSDFAALSRFLPPTPAQPQQAATPGGGEPPVAMLRTRAQMTVPWHLTEDEVNQMRAAGVPDEDIFSIPGRVA